MSIMGLSYGWAMALEGGKVGFGADGSLDTIYMGSMVIQGDMKYADVC